MPMPAAATRRIAYRCPRCDRKLGEFMPHEKRLGVPELVCPKCGVRTPCEHRAEWANMTKKERHGAIIGIVLSAVFAGGALGILLGAAVAVILYLLGAGDTAAWIGLCVLIAAGMLLIAWRGTHGISKSKMRTEGRNL